MKLKTLFVRCCICMLFRIFISGFVKGEPCKDYSSMPNASKRSPSYILDVLNDTPISDDRLVKKWYKIEFPAGDRMPTQPPGIFRCGTRIPIWINGALPTVPTTQTTQPVCVQGLTNDCEQTWTINIKYCCGNFFVYELVPSSIQDSGYCFGDSSDLTSTSSYFSVCDMHCCLNMESMDDIKTIFNQTLFRCLYQFKTYCTPSCGQFQSADIVSACVNISIQAILDRMMYNLDTRVNDQYEADVAVPLYGYITPVLAIVTTIFDMLIFCVLSKKSFRSPTNFILICIAVCDTITILSPLTWYVHTYSSNGYQDYPIYTWCLIHRYFGSLIPTCFHNSAVWLTVMLSIHRYIGISHPNLARILCCYKAVITGTICICVLLIILIFSLLIFEEIEKVTVISKDMLNSQGLLLIETCYFKKSSNIFYDSYATYFKVYPSLRVVLCNIIPCILLIVFNTLLIRTTYQSYRYRQKLLKGSIKCRNFEVPMIVRTTIMLLSICFLTLLVEVPYGIIISLQVIQSIWEISVPSLKLWITFPNFILFLTYPTHFIIFVTMNRRFRTYLVNIFCKRRRIDGINSISGSMEGKLST